MEETRKEQYERKRTQLMERCGNCRKISAPSWDRCNYHCSTGATLRRLETEYSDITGWSHDKWNHP